MTDTETVLADIEADEIRRYVAVLDAAIDRLDERISAFVAAREIARRELARRLEIPH